MQKWNELMGTVNRSNSARVMFLILIVLLLGFWQIISTVVISKDGVYWIEFAQQIESWPICTDLYNGMTGQKYALCSLNGRDGNAGVHISIGTNGVSVYELGDGHMPALAVCRRTIGKEWNHIAITFADKQPSVYINGMLCCRGLTSQSRSVAAPTRMGGAKYGYFKGDVHGLYIWDRSLTDREILSDFNKVRIKDGLLCGWKMSEGAGTKLFDSSGHKYRAVIHGPAWTALKDNNATQTYALSFDGIDDTVTLDYPAPTNNFTVSAWIKAVETHQIDSKIVTRDPGYPFLIHAWHGLLSRFGFGNSSVHWILAAQILNLICRILVILSLYCLGELLVGDRYTFWALLILILLPWPAEYAQDVLREWPYLLFLSIGMVLILKGFTGRRIHYFLPAGLIAGLGHTIRPECAQIVIYSICGLVFAFLRPCQWMTRRKAVSGLMLLMIGYGAVFIPYVNYRGQVLPLKMKKLLTWDNTPAVQPVIQNAKELQNAGFSMPIRGLIDLAKNLSENLMYYYFPFLCIGLYVYFRDSGKTSIEKRLLVGFFVLNAILYILLFCRWGYISRRHVLALTAVSVFFVPIGLDTAAGLIRKRQTAPAGQINRQHLSFITMVLIGIALCFSKLAVPLRSDKTGYRKTAEYLKKNTSSDAFIAVPDCRIAFYAERNRIDYKKYPAAVNWDYLVTIGDIAEDVGLEAAPDSKEKIISFPIGTSKDASRQIITYRRVR